MASLTSSLLVLAACGGASGPNGEIDAQGNAAASSDNTAAAATQADAMAQAQRARRPGTAPSPAPAAPQPLPGPAPAVTNFAVLTWTAPIGNVTGYRVYYGTSSRNYQQALGGGAYYAPSKEVLVTNLTQGSTYYFAVTAIDAAGQESAYSTEATKLIP